MCRKFLTWGSLSALVLFVAFGREATSYVQTCYGWARDSVKTSIPLDFEIDRAAADQRLHAADFFRRRRNVLLPAVARVHRHHEHEIDDVDHMLDGLDRRRRIHRYAGLLAEIADRLQRAVQVRARFDVREGAL